VVPCKFRCHVKLTCPFSRVSHESAHLFRHNAPSLAGRESSFLRSDLTGSSQGSIPRALDISVSYAYIHFFPVPRRGQHAPAGSHPLTRALYTTHITSCCHSVGNCEHPQLYDQHPTSTPLPHHPRSYHHITRSLLTPFRIPSSQFDQFDDHINQRS
jgi:hypothetical protein